MSERMMPGQQPYTPEEYERVLQLIREAAELIEMLDAEEMDELEREIERERERERE